MAAASTLLPPLLPPTPNGSPRGRPLVASPPRAAVAPLPAHVRASLLAGGGNGRAGTIDALRVCALYSLSQESDSKAAQAKISELAQALDRHEPMNAPLFFKVSRTFARLAGRNPSILSLTLALSEKACSLAERRGSILTQQITSRI